MAPAIAGGMPLCRHPCQTAMEGLMNDHLAFWSRVFTYIPTPTKDDGETTDETRLRQVIDYQIEHHVDGICVLGSTGGRPASTQHGCQSDLRRACRYTSRKSAVVRMSRTTGFKAVAFRLKTSPVDSRPTPGLSVILNGWLLPVAR
jgi:hypothetical protein